MAKSASNLPTKPNLQLEKLERARTSENQLKFIQQKYLKKNENVDAWLKRVARNIAFAELLYHPEKIPWGLFNGVRLLKKNYQNPDGSDSKAWFFHHGLHTAKERDSNFRRFVKNCDRIANDIPEAKHIVNTRTVQFYELLGTWSFLPNSPALLNAGRDLQQLSACYVLPVDDSIEGITDALRSQALIHKSGGGTGFSFENLRPIGDKVQSTTGVASGVTNFLHVFDKMTEVVKQGGHRRGANMGLLPYWHPEIRNFMALKNRPGQMETFNLAIAVDDRFMTAVESDWTYEFRNPHTDRVEGKVSARGMFESIAENIWKSGSPGIIFTNNINNSASNPTPAFGSIHATNPYGEQPLLPNEACSLGSLNLAKFIDPNQAKPAIDWPKLKSAVILGIRFLDNMIDMNNYPLPEIEMLSKGNRRIGMGVMGWAELLEKFDLPYDSEPARQLAEDIMSFINAYALEASEFLAKERGVFPNWKHSIYDPEGPYYKGEKRTPRHCARTTIAPTGTISAAAGLQGRGIEPMSSTAGTISMENHVKMQAAFQKHTDNGVSKKIRLSNKNTAEDIRKAIWLAYRSGCKGILFDRNREELHVFNLLSTSSES